MQTLHWEYPLFFWGCHFSRLQAAVTVTPGLEFSPQAEDSVRLNFSQDHGAAVAAVERLAALVEWYRS